MQMEFCKIYTSQDIYTCYTLKGLHYMITFTKFRAWIFNMNVPFHILSQM
jgi:hypothetical protein